MSIARRIAAGLKLTVLAGVCGVVLGLAVAGSVLFAYRWGEARGTSPRSAAAVLGEMSNDQSINQTHGGIQG